MINMLKNYKIGVDMLIEALLELSLALEDDDLLVTANHFMKAAYFYQITFALLTKAIEEAGENRKKDSFPEFIKDDD